MAQPFRNATHQQVPDDIRNGMQYTPLAPAVEPQSTYAIPSLEHVGSTTGENMLSQLAAGLERLNPGLQAIAGNVKQRYTQEELDQAEAQFQKAKAQNIRDFKQAQDAGLIPLGASPLFIESFKMNQLKLAAEQSHQLMQEAWHTPENDLVRNYEVNLEPFEIWAKRWRGNYNKDFLSQYTDREIHQSGYHQIMDRSEAQLRGQQLDFQIKERERLAGDTASNLILQRLDAAFDNHAVSSEDYPAIGKSIQDVFNNKETGLSAYGGLKGATVAEITREAIITKAVQLGDASILEVAHHVGQDPDHGNTLAKTKAFRDAADKARQHIANTNWFDEERSRKRAEQKGLGLESLDAVEARARQDRGRIEEEYQSQKLHRDQYEKSVTRQSTVEPELQAIVKLHAVDGDTTSKEIRDHLKNIAASDPDTYKSITSWLQSQARQQGHAVDEQAALMTFTRLRASISDNPLKFDSRSIIQEAKKGHISASQVNELFGLVDRSKKEANEFPIMSSPLVNGLRSDLRGAVGQGPLDDFGVGRIRADKAAADLNGLIAGYLRSHPKATEYEVYTAIQPHVERIARKHSEELNQSLSYADKQSAPKAEASQGSAQGPDRRAQLDAQLQSKYPNKKQRDEIVNNLLRQQGVK